MGGGSIEEGGGEGALSRALGLVGGVWVRAGWVGWTGTCQLVELCTVESGLIRCHFVCVTKSPWDAENSRFTTGMQAKV